MNKNLKKGVSMGVIIAASTLPSLAQGSIDTKTDALKKEYDYIVVGAGAGGSALASRLSEDPTKSVALIEAGGENINDISRIQGAFYRVWGTDYDWQYNSTPQETLAGRSIYIPRGKVVGGSTAINVGVWLRGAKGDYDSWEAQGATGWNYNEALRLFQKIEDTNRGPNAYRGKGGAMHMEDMANASPLADSLLTAFVEAGFGPHADTNGENPNSVARTQSIYRNHVRNTAADCYLNAEVRKRENLTIITHTTISRVLFEGNKVTGVEGMCKGESVKIAANKEVILCAGAINTPKILLLSGIGNENELKKLGIDVVANVPGVGKNLSDHLYTPIKVLAPKGVTGSIPADTSDKAVMEWVQTKEGGAIYYTGNTMGFMKVDPNEVYPEYELVMDYNHGASGSEAAFAGIDDVKQRSGYNVSIVQLQPVSRGSVTLKSTDPNDAPIIDPAYFSDPVDMKKYIKAFRLVNQKLTTTEALKGYTEVVEPAVDADDATIEAHIRNTATTVFHPAGTARMGSLDDPMTVVDPCLKVRGVEGLRVADASVLPQVNRGHTMAPTIFVGERLAELIKMGR